MGLRGNRSQEAGDNIKHYVSQGAKDKRDYFLYEVGIPNSFQSPGNSFICNTVFSVIVILVFWLSARNWYNSRDKT